MKMTKYLMTLAAAALAFTACEVEPADLFSTEPVAPVLDAHADILITEPTMNELVTFSWSAARNIGQPVSYKLFAACEGSAPAEVGGGQELACTLTKSALLNLLEQRFNIPSYQVVPLTFTVTATGSDGVVYTSDPASVNVYANSAYLPPVLEAVAASVTLDANKPSEGVALLTWEPSHIGVNEAVAYNVYAKTGSSDWNEIATELTGTSYETSAKSLNDLLLGLGVEAGATAAVDFRVTAFATSAPAGLASNSVTIGVTTYADVPALGAWSLIGNVNGDTSWSVDAYMSAVDNGLWVSDVVAIGGEFKLRFNRDWSVNVGGSFAAFGEPFEAVRDGGNINVAPGDYYVSYDEVNGTIAVHELSTGWGLIGDALAKGWDGDTYKLLETEPGVFRSGAVKLAAGGFKLRFANGWDTNFGGTFAAYGQPFTAVAGGDNIALPDSDVTVYITLDTNRGTITVDNSATRFAGRWGVVGQVNGMNWDGDVFMYPAAGSWRSVPFRVDGGFKIRMDAAWNADRGGNFEAFGTAFAVWQGGPNIELGGDNLNKFVTLVYDPAAEQIAVIEVK